MNLRRPVLSIAFGAGILVASGCGSESTAAPAASAGTTSTTTAVVAPVTTVPTTYSDGMFGGSHSAACTTDQTLMETAVEAFLAINGGTEATEDQLIAQGLLREPSVLHDIGPGATVIPSPTGGCVD